MEKQNNNLRNVAIALMVLLAVLMIYFIYDKIVYNARAEGIIQGKNAIVFQIQLDGKVPMFNENYPDNTGAYDWIPINSICVQSGVCTAWCKQSKWERNIKHNIRIWNQV